MKLTKLGKNLLAKAIAEGTEIHFTRGAIGSGNLDEGEQIHDLTELKKFEMWLPITSSKVVGNGTAEITCYLSNAELSRGFKAKEHGLFALNETGNEILFSYRNLGEENYDFIPAYTSTAHKNIFLTYEVEIQDAENITATLDLSVAYINTEDFKEHVESAHPHLNTPNHYNDVETTAEIWATDAGDNHLHKISIDNLKNILREDIQTETAINPAEELGLNANILMVEDFTSGGVLDDLKIAVTSCAENGNLIGVADIKNLETGARYIITDGAAAEIVDVQSIRKNQSGYYAKLFNPLANSYKNPILYRTTAENCKLQKITWQSETFSGVHANVTRDIPLQLDSDDIQGDGFLNAENYFTMG